METKANRVLDDDIANLLNAGDFYWTGMKDGKISRMMFVCPCGCGDICGVTVKPGCETGWDWDGNLDCPTLKPSILISNSRGEGEHWHGFLTGGRFVT